MKPYLFLLLLLFLHFLFLRVNLLGFFFAARGLPAAAAPPCSPLGARVYHGQVCDGGLVVCVLVVLVGVGVPEVALEVGVGNGVVADRALATGVLEFLRRNKLGSLFYTRFDY